MAGNSYRPTVEQARAALDKPLDPEVEFDATQKMLAEAQESGKIDPLISQERAFISFFKMGLSWQAAARGSGMSTLEATKFMDSPRGKLAAEYVAAAQTARIEVNTDLLTFQYYEAISEAETAGEKIRGLDSVAKLHRLGGFDNRANKPAESGKLVGSGLSPEAQKKKLSRMTTEQLMEAGAIDAEFYEPQEINREEK